MWSGSYGARLQEAVGLFEFNTFRQLKKTMKQLQSDCDIYDLFVFWQVEKGKWESCFFNEKKIKAILKVKDKGELSIFLLDEDKVVRYFAEKKLKRLENV